MATVSIHLPESLHQSARDLATRENIPLDQLITLALAKKMSALLTADLLGEQARLADRKAFEAVLAKVPDVPAEPFDAL